MTVRSSQCFSLSQIEIVSPEGTKPCRHSLIAELFKNLLLSLGFWKGNLYSLEQAVRSCLTGRSMPGPGAPSRPHPPRGVIVRGQLCFLPGRLQHAPEFELSEVAQCRHFLSSGVMRMWSELPARRQSREPPVTCQVFADWPSEGLCVFPAPTLWAGVCSFKIRS